MEPGHSFLTNGLATEKSFSLEPLLKEAQKLLRKPIKDLRYNDLDVLFYLQCTLCLLPCVGFQCVTVLCNVVPYTPAVCPCLCSVWYGSENTLYNGPCFVSIDKLLCVYLLLL